MVMTIKYHLSNGCSFSTKKRYLSCHQKLGELLALEPTLNLAKGGRGNDRCVQTTMHWFLKNPERMKDTFVSIGWSSAHRWDYVHKLTTAELIERGVKGYKFEVAKFDRQWASWRTWEQDWISRDKDCDIDASSAVRLYTNIITLQNFFKLYQIPYVMYWALTNDLPTEGDFDVLYNAIDQKHFMNFKPSKHAQENISIYNKMKSMLDKVTIPNADYVQSHFEYCAKHGWTKSVNDGHPNHKGHHGWAQLLYNFVQSNKLLSND